MSIVDAMKESRYLNETKNLLNKKRGRDAEEDNKNRRKERGIGDFLKSLGKSVGKIVTGLIPGAVEMVGSGIGGAIFGEKGAEIGAALGQGAGKLLGNSLEKLVDKIPGKPLFRQGQQTPNITPVNMSTDIVIKN